eukprot:11155832-Lingulodinium_polyedra.AAC.1
MPGTELRASMTMASDSVAMKRPRAAFALSQPDLCDRSLGPLVLPLVLWRAPVVAVASFGFAWTP